VHAFVTVVKHHSFARAAQELDMTPSWVSRLVKALEQQLGVTLINRTTRTMALTEAGQRYFSDCAAALEQLRGAFERSATNETCPAAS
jgi:DNA-binding transcriptional LysR family regulator